MKTVRYFSEPNRYSQFLIINLFAALSCWVGLISCQRKEEEPWNEQIEITSEEMRPDDYFTESLEAFANQNYKMSSDAIKKAAVTMEVFALTIEGAKREAIMNSVNELRELATNVSLDKVDGINELNYFFARAGKTLAGLHMHITESYYFSLRGKEAGFELLKAIEQTERTVKYHGREFDAEEKELIKEMKSFASTMALNGKGSKEQMNNYLKKLSDHLTKWQDELTLKYSSIENKRKVTVHKK